MKKQDQGLVSFSIYESVESVLAAGCTGLINLRHLFSFFFYGSKINRATASRIAFKSNCMDEKIIESLKI